MKIAVVVNEMDVMGGTHKQVVRLCEYLESKGINFTIFTKYYDLEKSYPEVSRFNVVHLGKKAREWNKDSSILNKLNVLYDWHCDSKKLSKLISRDYDVVNIHDNGLLTVITEALTSRQKVVWQINDLPGEFRVGNAKAHEVKHKIINEISKQKIRSIAQKVNAITVNVSKNRERVQEYLNKDAQVFYCGVDINEKFGPHNPIVGNQIKLLSTGVFFPFRNYDTLVKVVDNLRKKGLDTSLDIIGSTNKDAEYANKVQQLIDSLKLNDCIKIWGQVDNDTYNKLYNDSNIFLFMNVDQSWGLTVFEAMSAGIPTMVSDSVGAIELLHNEVDSIIMDPMDVEAISNKIIQLYTDKEYYMRISESGRHAVKEFTWDNLYSSKMLNLFETLYDESSKGKNR